MSSILIAAANIVSDMSTSNVVDITTPKTFTLLPKLTIPEPTPLDLRHPLDLHYPQGPHHPQTLTTLTC